jgi:cysteine desulfurase
MSEMDPVYFDHNSTSPVDPRVFEEMNRVAREAPANPESAHAMGRAARRELESARSRLARHLGARPEEIVFTSGGTESDNMALWGTAIALGYERRHLVISGVEHPAIFRAAEHMEQSGYGVSRLPVDGEGIPNAEDLAEAIDSETFLVSVMLANNETGAILPVKELAAVAKERGVLFHTDAVQAVGKIPVDVNDLGVDFLTATAHKFGGPRGIGLLYIRNGASIRPIAGGGDQEAGLRPGTVPTGLAAGFAMALDLAMEEMPARSAHLFDLTNRLVDGIFEGVPSVRRNGPVSNRIPNTLNLTVHGISGESILMALDREGFCVSTGSACTTGSALPSHVLTAMGLTREEVTSSVRLSLGADNTREEVDRLLDRFPAVIRRLRTIARGV